MSLFGKIASLDEILARLPQFQIQVEKLEEEESQLERGGGTRGSFNKRCQELARQISDQRQKVDKTRGSESTRAAAIMSLDDFQRRLYSMAPERASTSRSSANSAEPREDDVTPTSGSHPLQATRRPSMYDDYQSSSDEESAAKTVLPALTEEESSGTPPTPAPRRVEVQPASRGPITQVQRRGKPLAEKKTSSSIEDEEPAPKPPRSTSPGVVEGNRFAALADLNPQEKGDLPLKKGQIVQILMTRPDGWWKAMNEKGEQGMVPKTYLQHIVPEEIEEIVPMRREIDRIADERDREKQRRLERDKQEIEEKRREVEAARRQLEADRRTQQREMLQQMEEEKERLKEEHMQSLLAQKQGQIEESKLPRPTIRPPLAPLRTPVTCLGDALRTDSHLTFQCHLTPRLSHSNLAFHDLFWNYETDKLRKRRVTVSKVIRLVRLESMPTVELGLIRIALYDQSKKTGRQIVSNVHTIKAQVKNGTWIFLNRTDTATSGIELGEFNVRSNYRMVDVVLLLEASIVEKFEAGFREKTVGIVKIPIMGNNGETCLINKTYSDYLLSENIFQKGSEVKRTNSRIYFKITDVTKDNIPYVDSMPDVLIFNPMYLQQMYFYRRRAGTVLIRDRDNPMNAEIISDPLLAVFPAIADQPDLMDLLNTMFKSKYTSAKAKKAEPEQAMDFFQVFMNTVFCIHNTAIMPDYCIWNEGALKERQKAFEKCIEMLKEYKTASRYLLTVTSRPINIYDYSFNLLGPHALD